MNDPSTLPPPSTYLEQAQWLAQTKLCVPQVRTDIVPRQRLTAWLKKAAGETPLTLISAPPGYGKTTLLASLPSLLPEMALAWLSLDEEDDDPNRFLAGLIGSLQKIDPQYSARANLLLPILPSTSADQRSSQMRRAFSALINDVLIYQERIAQEKTARPILLVLDDLHFVSNEAIYQGLNYLLEHQPPQLHLVIATRRDPPLSLPRLRARRRLSELRWVDMRFTYDESAALLNETLGLSLPPADLQNLHQFSEGWPAGLNLLASSLSHARTPEERSRLIAQFPQDSGLVFDFLAEEVLNRQPPHLRSFLLQTSILGEMTAALCQAISGYADSKQLLEILYRDNVFITFIEEDRSNEKAERIYRYHALFARFLRQQLQRELPGQIKALHQRAALACSSQPDIHDPARVMEHLMAAEMWEQAAGYLENSGEKFINLGLLDILTGWIAALPQTVIKQYPRLAYLAGLCAIQKGDLDQAQQQMEDALQSCEQIDNDLLQATQGAILAGLASIAFLRTEAGASRRYVQQALGFPLIDYIQVQTHMTSASLALFFENNWDQALVDLKIAIQLARASSHPEALLALALFLGQEFTLLKGGLDLLEDFCLEIRAQIGEQFTPVQLGINDVLAFIHLRRGRLTEAIQAGERALAVKEHLGGYPFIGLNAALVIATAYAAQRDYHPAGLYLQQMLREIDPLPLNRFTLAGGYYPLFRLLWLQDRLEEADQVLGQLYQQIEDDPQPSASVLVGNILRFSAKGLQAIKQHHYPEAEQAFLSAEQAIRQHQAASLATIFVCPRLLRAYLYQRWKRPQAALQTAAPLLEQCQADHTPGLILQEGELAVPVLQLLARQEKYSAYASQLLQCLEPGQEHAAQTTPGAEAPADFHLTQREIEVLRLLAQGINNRAIAEKLVISLPTVKTHVAHILEKLHVSSRGEAAALAHQHRLHL